MKTIEERISDTILEKEIASIEIDGEAYKVGAPSIATLILVSEIVSTMPIVSDADGSDPERLVQSVLRNARYFSRLGELAAVLILGAKGLTETIVEEQTETKFFGLWKKTRLVERVIDKKAKLAKLILDNVRPSVLWQLILKRLNLLDVGDFFAITTSLTEVNLLKPTREVEN